MRIWLDTDIGSDVDDALALAYLLRHPDLELVGISTVFGDTPLRTRIATELLSLAGAPECPIVTGLGKPLTEGRPGVMFGHEGLGLFEDPTPEMRVQADADPKAVVDALAAAIDTTQPDGVLSIGPMTNLGALARAGVRLPRLSIMGGRIRDLPLPMDDAIPEWNWWCDPLAVQAVLAAPHPAPPIVVPIEVTYRTVLSDAAIAALGDADPLGRALHRLSGEWLRAQTERLGFPRAAVLLHDPLAAAMWNDPPWAHSEPLQASIDDGARTTLGTGAALDVVTDVELAALEAHLVETWTRSG